VIARQEPTNPHTSEYARFHFAERREASFFDSALASAPLKPSTENTGGLLLLLLLVPGQALLKILVSVGGRFAAGIHDSYVKDSRGAPPPEPVDRNVAAEFWGRLCAFSASPSVAVPTSVDLRFVGDGGRS
jgi:hypothetical protein